MPLLNAYLKRRKTFEKGVAIADKKGNDWEHSPHTLAIPDLKIEGDFYGFHVNAEETVLIISNKGHGTYGEEDLYVSLKETITDEWGSPIHLGPKINTEGFEMSPYLSSATNCFAYSSRGTPKRFATATCEGESRTFFERPLSLPPGVTTVLR